MFLLALAVSVSVGVSVAVPDLDAAQKAYVDVDYARCRDRAQAALLQPAAQKERVDAWRLLGLCSAATGDLDEAREAFRMMLAIDKDAKLPDGLSPRFTSSYREAKGSWVGAKPLALTVADDAVDKDGRTVRVKVDDDAELISRLAWRGPSGTLSSPVKKAPQIEFELPAGVDLVVIAFDKAQGEVASLSLPARKFDTSSPLDPEKPVVVAEDEEGSGAAFVVVGAVAAAVVVIGAAAGVAAVLFSPPQSVNLKTEVVFAD